MCGEVVAECTRVDLEGAIQEQPWRWIDFYFFLLRLTNCGKLLQGLLSLQLKRWELTNEYMTFLCELPEWGIQLLRERSDTPSIWRFHKCKKSQKDNFINKLYTTTAIMLNSTWRPRLIKLIWNIHERLVLRILMQHKLFSRSINFELVLIENANDFICLVWNELSKHIDNLGINTLVPTWMRDRMINTTIKLYQWIKINLQKL